MKRLVFLLTLITVLCGRMKAGENDTYFGFNAGVLYPRIFNITAQYEFESKYHNAWEIYLDYATQWNKCRTCGKVCMDSFWKEEYAYGLGVAYKPVFTRGKNSFGRFRFGTDPKLRLGRRGRTGVDLDAAQPHADRVPAEERGDLLGKTPVQERSTHRHPRASVVQASASDVNRQISCSLTGVSTDIRLDLW